MPSGAEPLVEHFFRHEYGRLAASLTRRFGAARLDDIEEAIQTALAKALATWNRTGVPDNPSAWLTRVAYNEVVDQLRRQQTSSKVALELDRLPLSAEEPVVFDTEVADDQLRMLFVCCDEELPPKSRLVLALKLLCGFSAREIARCLFLTEANVLKLVTRGKQRLAKLWQESNAEARPDPTGEQLARRLAAVQRVVYLLFNQGYSAHDEDEQVRRDLCAEALRLSQMLTSHPTAAHPASWALLSLLHFHTARLPARRNATGDLLMLDEQDRRLWDPHHIQLGLYCLAKSGEGDHFGSYHAEAAIQAEHCLAPRYEATNWEEIAELYELIERAEPSPLYTLNRAIAIAEAKGPEAGLAVLRQHAPPSWLQGYYLWDGAIGELLRRAGKHDAAIRYLERALTHAPTRAEKQIFERRLRQAQEARQLP